MIRFGILIVFIMLVSFFSGCTEKKKGEEGRGGLRSIADSRGVEVFIPERIESIATFPVPHPHVIVYLDGNGRRIKGLHPLAKKAAAASVLGRIAGELLETESGFLTGSNINSEELLRLDPDIFFTDTVLQGMENLEKSSLPVAYLGLEKEILPEGEVFSPEKSMENWIRITSEVLGTDREKAFSIMKEWRETRKEISEKLSFIADKDKKKILIMFKVKEGLVAGGNSFGQYWISLTGGINAASSVKGNHPAMSRVAGFEDILKWDPDIIYITNFDTTSPEDFYTDSTLKEKWSSVRAVKNNAVYKIPLGIYRWYPPGLDGPLMLKWMVRMNYPELFSWDIRDEIKKYFSDKYSYTLTEEEIDKILLPESSGSF